MTIRDASRYNLKHVTGDIPVGILTVFTGVAGAGKSTLLEVFLDRHPEAIHVDQSPIRTSTRSVTATYTGIMDPIRDSFARANDISRSLFSFNSEGAYPECQALGTVHVDLPFMGPVESVCEACGGKRYKDRVLDYVLRGATISEVLDMTLREALTFLDEAAIRGKLEALEDVGLGYLSLGQRLSSFSGGECQRLKLSRELHRSVSVYVLDEPTTGLHMADLESLLSMLNRLVAHGNSVIVTEHNLDVVKNADWVIDLGPEGGTRGGQVVFEGTPEEFLCAEGSFTAEYMRMVVS